MLEECLASLAGQTFRDILVVVVDNSECGRARQVNLHGGRLIENPVNVGFGAAINQGMRLNDSEFVASLNDDAVAHPSWLENLIAAARRRLDAGMFASQVRFYGEPHLDSAGMNIAVDGTSKQRGHNQSPASYSTDAEVLCPSGSAALYRRSMLDAIGGFDERFFLYCEDTDVGLRAQWQGWPSLYVSNAVVEHRYSHSAGRASSLKAYYVERNRLYLVAKNFPLLAFLLALLSTPLRYVLTAVAATRGRGAAGKFEGGVLRLAALSIKAHAAAVASLPWLLRERNLIRQNSKIRAAEFNRVLARHHISLREVASL